MKHDPLVALQNPTQRSAALEERWLDRKAVLTVIAGAGLGRSFVIRQSTVTIGRGEDSDIHVGDPGISRLHMHISRDDIGNYVLADLNSMNGIWVNGRRVTRHVLRDGDRIYTGNYTVLQLRYLEDNADVEAFIRYQHAVRDEETGAFVKPHFHSRLQEELEIARRRRVPLGLALIGIDTIAHLHEEIGNDGCRHILARVTETMSRHVRIGDVLARLGHARFGILLRGQGRHRTFLAAERIRAAVEESVYFWRETPLSLTVSCGVVSMTHGEDTDPSQLLREAEDYLFEAQSTGANATNGDRPREEPSTESPGSRVWRPQEEDSSSGE